MSSLRNGADSVLFALSCASCSSMVMRSRRGPYMLGQSTIEAVGLRFRYGRTWAVDGVSLEIPAGEILCIIGPNGAGKTTLLSLLGGMVLPQQGHVRVF